MKAIIDTNSWNRPGLFQYIQKKGNISDAEMFEVFNMGIGMMLIIDPKYKKILMGIGEDIKEVGRIEARNEEDSSAILKGLIL